MGLAMRKEIFLALGICLPWSILRILKKYATPPCGWDFTWIEQKGITELGGHPPIMGMKKITGQKDLSAGEMNGQPRGRIEICLGQLRSEESPRRWIPQRATASGIGGAQYGTITFRWMDREDAKEILLAIIHQA